MTWQAWCLVIWFVLNLVVSIALIGRKVTLTAGGAVLNLFIYTFLIWCVFAVSN